MYVVVGLIFGRAALAGQPQARAICIYAAAGVAVCYLIVRGGARIGLAPTTLAGLQGVFSIICEVWCYAIAGPVRGATLVGLPVIVVVCMFALRPRQILVLTTFGLSAVGGAMGWHAAHDPLHFPPAVEAVFFAIMAIGSLAVTFLTGTMSKPRAPNCVRTTCWRACAHAWPRWSLAPAWHAASASRRA